mmetsp:Transcript_7308/g.17711  ORF Transcript_7308/g.17711 Transcript_7308/m.17711 type:complete len:275 (-) Transcript_7308:1051-1875(-)
MPCGSRLFGLLSGHARRGPRTYHPHRRPLRAHEGSAETATRPQTHRDFRDTRGREVLCLLLRLPHLHHSGTDVPRGAVVHQVPRERLPGRGPHHRHADPSLRAPRRHPALPHGAGGDRHRVSDPLRTLQVARQARPQAQHLPGVRVAPVRDAVSYLRPVSCGGEEVCHRDQHRRGLSHHRRHLLRRRPRLLQAEGLQPENGHGRPRRRPRVAGVGQTAHGTRRPHGTRQVLSAVHGGGVPQRDAADDGAGDPAGQPRQHGAHAQGHGHQRHHPL